MQPGVAMAVFWPGLVARLTCHHCHSVAPCSGFRQRSATWISARRLWGWRRPCASEFDCYKCGGGQSGHGTCLEGSGRTHLQAPWCSHSMPLLV